VVSVAILNEHVDLGLPARANEGGDGRERSGEQAPSGVSLGSARLDGTPLASPTSSASTVCPCDTGVDKTDDGLAGEEGTFTSCSFWLAAP